MCNVFKKEECMVKDAMLRSSSGLKGHRTFKETKEEMTGNDFNL